MAEAKSPITKWYNGQCIFITGATGFMGKVLLEKLLYSCTGIETIYVLLRPKRGKSTEERIEDMWNLVMFERLRKSQPNAIKKVVPLNGDLSADGLGLDTKHIELLINNVSIVFHLGAMLKLEATLKESLELNLSGTARVIDLSKRIKNLKAFVHFSTAFCSIDIEELEERVYDCKENPRDVINVINRLNSDVLNTITSSIIAPHPNVYCYSKRLAETLVAEELGNMPVAIIRPSIVIPAIKEPLPGWVDNLNGPIGILAGTGKGVIRSIYAKGENRGQFIPVDSAINISIIIAEKIGRSNTKPKEVPVFNLTQDALLPITFQEVFDIGRAIVHENPFEMQIWYPDGDMRSTKFVHNIYSIFLHWLPAILIDLVMLICRQRTFMLRIQRKIYNGLELLEVFTVRQWLFKSGKFRSLFDYLTEEDKKVFPIIDINKATLEEYLMASILGARQYCLKEDLSSLPRCRQKQKVLYVVHKFCVYGFYLFILHLIYRVFVRIFT